MVVWYSKYSLYFVYSVNSRFGNLSAEGTCVEFKNTFRAQQSPFITISRKGDILKAFSMGGGGGGRYYSILDTGENMPTTGN